MVTLVSSQGMEKKLKQLNSILSLTYRFLCTELETTKFYNFNQRNACGYFDY